MKSGQQLSSSQDCLLSPIEITQVQSTQQALIESAVQNINWVIEFINHYRFRPTEYGQCYANMPSSKQSLAQDIELREKIAKLLIDHESAASLRKKIKNALRDMKVNGSELDNKLAEYDAITAEFIQHAAFMQLTAGEVAAIGVTLDNLIGLVRALLNQLSDDKVKTLLENKLEEFLAARDKVCACMKHHLKVFQDQQQFHYSDILLSYQNIVQHKVGVNLDIDMQQLWPDMSIVMPVPLLPFENDRTTINVKEFFAQYLVLDVGKVVEPPKLPEPLIAIEAPQPSPPPTVLGKAWELTGWCATGVGNVVYTVATSPVTLVAGTARYTSQMLFGKSEEPAAPAAPTTPLIQEETVPDNKPSPEENEKRIMKLMDDMMGSLDKARKISDQSLEEFRALDAWRNEIGDLHATLKSEVDRLKRTCFVFFRSHTIKVKRDKIDALERLLSATSLEDLQRKVRDEQQDDPKHSTVFYGRTSRTRALLGRIVGGVQLGAGVSFASVAS